MARMTPMKEDKNDIRNHRDLHMGSPEFMEHVPMFFNKHRAPVDMTGIYQGATCFLVSNGPSLAKLDLNLLKTPGVMIMSLNNGPVSLLKNNITPNFWTCVDQPSRFVKQIWQNPGITKFIPMATYDKPLWDNENWGQLGKNPSDCPNVIGYMRNEKFAGHRFFTESSFNWGCHKDFGGCRSVLLPSMRIPFVLGFRKLYLVGVDMNMTPDQKYHFEEGRTSGAVKCNNATYERFIKEYGPEVKKAADKLGYQIFNCNPESKLTCFPHVNFEDAIKDVKTSYGPADNIKSKGMYIEWDIKAGLTREQAENWVDTKTS
jgi:hypothetical protein